MEVLSWCHCRCQPVVQSHKYVKLFFIGHAQRRKVWFEKKDISKLAPIMGLYYICLCSFAFIQSVIFAINLAVLGSFSSGFAKKNVYPTMSSSSRQPTNTSIRIIFKNKHKKQPYKSIYTSCLNSNKWHQRLPDTKTPLGQTEYERWGSFHPRCSWKNNVLTITLIWFTINEVEFTNRI